MVLPGAKTSGDKLVVSLSKRMEGLVGGSERSQKAREKRARQWVIQETPFLVSCFACGLRYVSCRVDASVCNVDVKDATMLLLQRCEVLLMQVSVCVMLLMLLRACASVRACRRMPFADPNATHASRKHACNPPQPSPPKSNTPPTNMVCACISAIGGMCGRLQGSQP